MSRGAHLVGDSGKEGVFQLVERLESPGGFELGQGAVGPVEEDALPVLRLTGVVVDHDGLVADPDGPAVSGDGSIAHPPWIEGTLAPFVLGQHPLAVSRVHHGFPEARHGALLGRVPGDRLMLWADADPRTADLVASI